MSHNDIFGNAGGDWVGEIAECYGEENNFSLDPLFCDSTQNDYFLREDSPCLPDNNPGGVQIGALGLGCWIPTGVQADTPDRSGGITFGAHPKPFNSRTTIRFELEQPEWVTIGIYDLEGQLVMKLADQRFGSGRHELNWHGHDATGRSVSSGTYLVHLRATGTTQTRKISLLR